MRSTPPGNNTLLRIQREISEVTERENELRTLQQQSNGFSNGVSNRTPSPTSPTGHPVLARTISASSVNGTSARQEVSNGTCTRRFIPNTNARGVMQKFYKSRGKISAGTKPIQAQPQIAWQPSPVISSPAKALIPSDKPLRKGYIPVEERIQKELKDMKHRESELRTQRRRSQSDLMAALDDEESITSRSSSPIGLLRPARSYTQLLADEFLEDSSSAPASLRPARSLAELCDAQDEEIESPRALIQHWESRIKQSQEEASM